MDKCLQIAIACDHHGVEMKDYITEHFKGQYTFYDFGTDDDTSVDYPDYALALTHNMIQGKYDFGILICSTGIGMAMTANRMSGIRCADCVNVDMAQMSRKHQDANVLAIGTKYVTKKLSLAIVDAFLTTEFEGGRHLDRIKKIEEYNDRKYIQ